MRQYAAPPLPGGTPSGRLTDAVVRHLAEQPDRVLLAVKDADGAWAPVTARQFARDVVDAAHGLHEAGVRRGDRVAVLARTRYEWTALDYALWWVGAVSVPLYPTSAAEQVRGILADSGSRFLVVEDEDLLRGLAPGTTAREAEAALAAGLPGLEGVWRLLPEGDGPRLLPALPRPADPDDAVLEEVRRSVDADDVATIIYTSGTTAQPKGCMLTHRNLLFEVSTTAHELAGLFRAEDAATLVVLPLAHVFARILQVGALTEGVRLGHVSDVRTLRADLQTFRPTFLLGVPRVFENLVNAASQRAASDGRASRFDRAAEVAIAWSRAIENSGASRVLALRHRRHAAVYAAFREALGGRCEAAISGGAPLGERLAHFFRGAGVPLLEGYGLTETTGAATVNHPDQARVGSVGRPVPGTTVRVDEDGEVLIAGDHVMAGYWEDPAATAEVVRDGWFRTGDLGEIDADGFLRITGRKKEMLVTAGGKNVAPGPLEEAIRAHPLVGHALVVGDGRPFVAALLTLDREGYDRWAQEHGKGALPGTLDDPDLTAELQRAVDAANAAVSQAEAVRRFRVLAEEWTEESGALTPSRKLRRAVVLRQHRDAIAALYD